MAREKSRWWLPRRTALRIVPALVTVGVGALLFVVSSQFVATLSNKILLVLGVATVLATVVVLIRVGQHYAWTGFGESVQPKPETREIRPAKTLWDWLQLFIVPLALVLIGLAFSVQQDARQQQTEAKRAEAERELANQRAQDEALQAYLDQMGSLLLEKDLRHSKEHSEVRTLARARTLTVLRRVNRSRKNEIMHFLVDAGLVHRVGESAPVIELRRINLSGINLNNANLRGAILKKATLIGSHLRRADLNGADLSLSNLIGSHLSGSHLSGADLSEANLSHSHLRRADLSGINLNNANLNEAKLSKANLKEADLSGVFGLTDEQITAATTLEGATMPNGQQYEDWLKDKKAQGKDAKNE